jgi:transposase
MKQVTQVGVDVDSQELVCLMQRAGQRLPLATFANSAAGHKKFIRWATKGGHPARVCLEATGIYSLEFALALHHAKNVEVMVVNPRAIKDFCRARMQRAKTDAVDAGGILDYLQRMPFAAWQPPAPEILELQAINRRIVQLNTELTREKNRRHAAEFAGASADTIANDIEVNIHHLERRIDRMQQSGLKLVRGVPALATKLGHLVLPDEPGVPHPRRGTTFSISFRFAERKPGRQHRGEHVILEEKVMVEPGECMESRNPEDRIP